VVSSSYCAQASVEFVLDYTNFPLIPLGNVFEKDLVGRVADTMRNFVTFECL